MIIISHLSHISEKRVVTSPLLVKIFMCVLPLTAIIPVSATPVKNCYPDLNNASYTLQLFHYSTTNPKLPFLKRIFDPDHK